MIRFLHGADFIDSALAPRRPDRRRPAAGRAGNWLSVWRTT
ncbi:MAG: hypothetical protein ACLUHL_01170 [Dysosmobacter welbionis]